MTEQEVELIAAELAKVGGVSWHPERMHGPLKIVADRYRDRARLLIAALDRHRGREQAAALPHVSEAQPHEPSTEANLISGHAWLVGRTVLYRPPGDRRAYACRVEIVDGDRAYLVPAFSPNAGWVEVEGLLPEPASEMPQH